MQAGVSLLDTNVMPIFMIIALDIIITLRSSINCSTVICSPTVILMLFGEKPLVKPMALGFIFHHISFRSIILVSDLLSLQSFTFHSINQKYQKYYFTVYPSLSDLTLQITVKGLTTPLSRWVQVGACLCRYSVTCALSPTGLIHWFSKLREILTLLCYITLSSSREKPTQAQEVAGRISGAIAGEIFVKSSHTKYLS